MESIVKWFSELYDVQGLIAKVGYFGMALIIFAETGVLAGFFLPGDSLLFAAGLACAPNNSFVQNHLIPQPMNIFLLNAILIPAAILGDALGYQIGFRVGKRLYDREKTFFFRKDHLLKTKAFYEKYGGATIVMARFMPIVRTFAPVVAGIAQMPYSRFFSFNVFGGIGWIISLTTLGYFLGQNQYISKHLEVTIMVIIFVSLLPGIISLLKARYFDKPQPPENGKVSATLEGAAE